MVRRTTSLQTFRLLEIDRNRSTVIRDSAIVCMAVARGSGARRDRREGRGCERGAKATRERTKCATR
ncbi:MAG TPA: hypothetical protein VFJ06_07365, partial [Halococcus sp.]|nr:hypothetical protein [Halococcus sp.]